MFKYPMYWIDNVTSGMCNGTAEYLYMVHDIGCNWIQSIGNFCQYMGAVSLVRNLSGEF